MMTETAMAHEAQIKCPDCNSEAIYKNGRAWTGKQRYLCLMCGRQFTHHTNRSEVKGKPACQTCGKIMNLYKIEGSIIRFRCSGYPECRTFKKFRIVEE